MIRVPPAVLAPPRAAAEDDGALHPLRARQLLLHVLEFWIVLGDVFVHCAGFVELALALEIQRQVVHQVEQAVVDLVDALELVERHVELALALEGQAEHLVALGALGVRGLLALLGDAELLHRHEQMAEHQQQGRRGQLEPQGAAGKQHELGHQQGDHQAGRDQGGTHRRQPGHGEGEVGGEQQEQRQLGPAGPGWARIVVLLQQARHGVRQGQHWRHRRRHRGGEAGADAARGGTDQDDLVLVLLHRDLAGVDVVERIDRERRLAVAAVVEMRVHAQLRIGADAQAAQRHAFAQAHLDVGGLPGSRPAQPPSATGRDRTRRSTAGPAAPGGCRRRDRASS